MEPAVPQPVKPTEEQRPSEFDVNAFQQLLRTLQERKEQGRTFQDYVAIIN